MMYIRLHTTFTKLMFLLSLLLRSGLISNQVGVTTDKQIKIIFFLFQNSSIVKNHRRLFVINYFVEHFP